ncbi:MAG: hypothetical protein OHK0029_26760 [Armatimonadaceae bacterium]
MIKPLPREPHPLTPSPDPLIPHWGGVGVERGNGSNVGAFPSLTE